MKTKNLINIMLVLIVALSSILAVAAEEVSTYPITTYPTTSTYPVTTYPTNPTTSTYPVTTYPTNPPISTNPVTTYPTADIPSVSNPIGGDVGFYDISSNPSGATASVDGTPVGLTPTTATLYVTGPPGHTVTISKQGYQTWSQYYSGNPAAGQHISVYATLVPDVQTGTIYVSSSPSGASAILDNGYDQVITPGTFYSVSTGSHTVQVMMSGYQQYSTSVSVSPGATSNVYATLTPNQQVGSISVSSVPKSASVYIDNIFQGMTNVVVGNLAAGSHTVTLKLAGYQTWTNTVTVNNQQTTYITATLTPISSLSTGDLQVSSSPSGAAIYLNGDYQGTTLSTGPFSITGLNPGTYTTVLKKTGYQDYTTSTTIVAGTTTQVSAVLQPTSTPSSTASAEITSDPSGADVYINNAYKGITPLVFQNVPIDSTQAYTVTIKLTGYETYTTSGKISPGQNIQINAALTPSSQPASTGGSNTIWYIIGGIGVVAVIILIVYLVMQRKKPEEP